MKFYVCLFFALAGLAAGAADIKISEENIRKQEGIYRSWDIETWKRKKLENGFLYFQELANARLQYVEDYYAAIRSKKELSKKVESLKKDLSRDRMISECKDLTWLCYLRMAFMEMQHNNIKSDDLVESRLKVLYELWVSKKNVIDNDTLELEMVDFVTKDLKKKSQNTVDNEEKNML